MFLVFNHYQMGLRPKPGSVTPWGPNTHSVSSRARRARRYAATEEPHRNAQGDSASAIILTVGGIDGKSTPVLQPHTNHADRTVRERNRGRASAPAVADPSGSQTQFEGIPVNSPTILDRKTISIMKACELVGVSRRTIYNWIAAGKIEYVRTAGGSVRIFADTLWREPGVAPAVRRDSWLEEAHKQA
jgi:excisionase family DNA binding protein